MSGISVIIPTFNMRQALERCLGRIVEQTLQPSEIVIVDDGSTDGTAVWVGEHKSSVPIETIFISQNHTGASAARNNGFSHSMGELIIFLDADVVLKKHALERLQRTLYQQSTINNQHLQVGYAYSSFRWGWKKFSSYPFDANRLQKMPYIHTTSLIKREALPEKPFDEQLKRLQDWDLYLTLLERGYGGVYIPEVLFTVEVKGSMSAWLPSIMYQIPFSRFGVKISTLEKYRAAEHAIKDKHRISNKTNL
ncbi:MAG: glycosyltransferase family 2 protein [Patescibacteria group bacterium]